MNTNKQVLEQIGDGNVKVENIVKKDGSKESVHTGHAGFNVKLVLRNGKSLNLRVFATKTPKHLKLKYFVNVGGIEVEVFKRYVPIVWKPSDVEDETTKNKYFTRAGWFDGQMSCEFDEKLVKSYQEQEDGSLREAEKFKKTKEMVEEKRISMFEAELWIPKEIKQLVADAKSGSVYDCLELAKELQKNFECIVSHYTNGNTTEMCGAIIIPWFDTKTNEFSLLMKLTRADESIALDKRMSMDVQKTAVQQSMKNFVVDVTAPQI